MAGGTVPPEDDGEVCGIVPAFFHEEVFPAGGPADAGRIQPVGYAAAFTFVFSPRRGTEAAGLTAELVAHEVKVARMERLVELVQRQARERAQRFVGRTVEVLVEGASRTDPDRLRGRTRHNKVVNFSGLATAGELTMVEVHSATSQTLAGEERLLARAG